MIVCTVVIIESHTTLPLIVTPKLQIKEQQGTPKNYKNRFL